VDVSPAQESTNKMAFYATVEGVTTYPNVWVHAVDARTIFPQPDVPAEVAERKPAALDARVEIVWPHAGAPVAEADLANISVYLFVADTRVALAPGLPWSPVVRLHRSLNTDAEVAGTTAVGLPRTIEDNGMRYLAWDFNDVNVSAARDPLNRIYFWVSVDDVPTATNVWAHGADARTYLPEPEVLASCE
jgi:hypothetical protein